MEKKERSEALIGIWRQKQERGDAGIASVTPHYEKPIDKKRL